MELLPIGDGKEVQFWWREMQQFGGEEGKGVDEWLTL
jgi:hypothetical protein